MTYAARGAFLDPVDFNPLEFGISPVDLQATDTSQLLGLVAEELTHGPAKILAHGFDESHWGPSGLPTMADLDELTDIKKGTPLNPTRNRQACLAIQQRYKEKGRLFASVVLEEGANPGDSDRRVGMVAIC